MMRLRFAIEEYRAGFIFELGDKLTLHEREAAAVRNTSAAASIPTRRCRQNYKANISVIYFCSHS